MAILVFSEISSLAQDRAQVNVATDAPLSAAEIARFINDAYSDVWEISGGSVKRVAGATAWATQPTADATGVSLGILTDIDEVIDLWATTTSASTGGGSGDVPLDRVEQAYIMHMRAASGYGSYTTPQVYALSKLATVTPADVNKMRLDVFPGASGIYFPIHYVPQFSPIDSATVTTPDVNDLESRDIALLAAARIAPLVGRAELVPSILADVSQRTQEAIERKMSALLYGKQDR